MTFDTIIKAKDILDAVSIFMENLNETIYLLEIEWNWPMLIATIVSFLWAVIETMAPIWITGIIVAGIYKMIRNL